MRMFRPVILSALWLLLACLLSTPLAWAHKVQLFAYFEGAELVSESGFGKGRPCKECGMQLLNRVDGSLLLQGQSDAQGLWRTTLPPEAAQCGEGLLLVLDAGEGHRAEWKIAPEEYLHLYSGPAVPAAQASGPTADAPAGPLAATGTAVDPAALEAMVARTVSAAVSEAVARELAPVKKLLLQPEEPDWRGILGGLGYIFGLAGIYAYARSRKA